MEKYCDNGSRRGASGGRWQRLVFDGDENNFELWQVKFLGHLRMLGLKDTILKPPHEDVEADKN